MLTSTSKVHCIIIINCVTYEVPKEEAVLLDSFGTVPEHPDPWLQLRLARPGRSSAGATLAPPLHQCAGHVNEDTNHYTVATCISLSVFVVHIHHAFSSWHRRASAPSILLLAVV